MKKSLSNNIVQNTVDYFEIHPLYVGFFKGIESELKSREKTIIDKTTADALELRLLEQKLSQHSTTMSGRTRLATSLLFPSNNIEQIKNKQIAVKEVFNNEELRYNLQNILSNISIREKTSWDLITDIPSNESEIQRILITRELISESIDSISKLPDINSLYLNEIFNEIKDLNGSDIHKLSKENMYRQGIRMPIPKDQLELSLIIPPISSPLLSIRPFTGLSVAGLVGLIVYNFPYISEFTNIDLMDATLLSAGFAGLVATFLSGGIERDFSMPSIIRKFKTDEGAKTIYNSIGKLDEILSLSKFAIKGVEEGIDISMPEIIDSDNHLISANNLINLIQASKDPSYIPNKEISIEGFNFLTGPNSGGKTSISKALAHAQILGQMGSFVPASKAKLSLTDRIIYHVGMNDTQNDEEGGFGTQLKKSKEILELANPNSLVIIDDLMEGTTVDTITNQTNLQFYALYHTRADVLMITHRYDLAEKFKNDTGKGNYLQIGFDDNIPTRQIIPGISTDSKPGLVEERVGMDKKSITDILIKKGVIKPNQNIFQLK